MLPDADRKRILVSAFACSPLWGSESGIGWQWASRVAAWHDVVLVTHTWFRAHIEPELERRPVRGLRVIYFDAPWFAREPARLLNSRAYYYFWQWRLRRQVRRLARRESLDAIHHLTWGTHLFPCFLGGLGPPLVVGPLGGGEAAPLRLTRSLPWRERAFEALRLVARYLPRLDPTLRLGPGRPSLVLSRTHETTAVLPAGARRRSILMQDMGAPPLDLRGRLRRAEGKAGALALLYAGRLLGWKGASLAVGVVAALARRDIEVTLDIAGEGPLAAHLLERIGREGLSCRVRLRGMVPRRQLMDLYAEADVFLFPSLHDAGGGVVLEALSRGVPVVCLDLGGPQHYVNAECGVVVSTAGRSEREVEAALADAVAGLHHDRAKLDRMSRAAAEEAARRSWDAHVAQAYRTIAGKLGWTVEG